MASSITELPADVLRSICYYLSLPDVLRFGMTAKNMINNMWPYYQEVVLDRDWPIEAPLFVLSRDLSHVCDLDLIYRLNADQYPYDDQRIPDLIQGFNSLATSTLPNLHSLSIGVDFQRKIEHVDNATTSIQNLVESLTQLRSLYWYSAKTSNIGQLLSAHTRLTHLGTPWAEKICGLNLLTNLNTLTLNMCNLQDEAFSEVMELTRLTYFDFVYENDVWDASFTKISNLTNLEHLRMEHTSTITSASFNALFKLRKLYSLMIEYSRDDNQEEFTTDVSIFGRLSQLTRLGMRCSNSGNVLDVSLITGLTNLLQLDIEADFDNADFSVFTKLTQLTANPIFGQQKLSNLPINLKELFVFRCKLDNDEIEMICNLNNLQNIQLSDRLDPTFLAEQITRLTNMTDLTFIGSLPIKVIPALRKLPLLMSLVCPKLTQENILELALLTQLQELVYWDADIGCKEKLQQSVSYRVRSE